MDIKKLLEYLDKRPIDYHYYEERLEAVLTFYADPKNWGHEAVDDRGSWVWTPEWTGDDTGGPNPWDIAVKALIDD